jgi:glycosyltransferase involved in cell wall biosynthesis
MRIALVADDCSPLTQLSQHDDARLGAQTARVSPLALELARLGHRVTIYARRDAKGLPGSAILAPGVTVEHVTAGPAAPLPADTPAAHVAEFSSCLAQHWRRNRPDIAHAHSWTSGLAALGGARDLGVPVAQTFGSLAAAEQRHLVPGRQPTARIRLESGIARSADVVLANSSDELADLARLGVSRARVRVVPCGVDYRRFTPDGPAAERNGRPRLLAAEPLSGAVGLDVAVRALTGIPGAELVITGGPATGEAGKQQARRDLRRMSRKLAVDDRLVFTGAVGHSELPALLRSADLLVSTAHYEPAGLVAVQAMACGTPVVAATAGAERDAVIDSTTGLLVPPRQPRQLALRIRRLLGNSMQLEAYGIAAADRARSRYSWERIARETLAAYGSVLRRPAAAAALPEGEPAGALARGAIHAGARA